MFGIDVLLKQFGRNVESVFNSVELSASLLDMKEEPIEYVKFLHLLNKCAEVTGRSDFGIMLTKHQDVKILGALGLAIREAPTIRVAMENLRDFMHVHMHGLKVSLSEEKNHALFSYRVTLPFAPDYRQQIDLAMGLGIRFFRRFIDSAWAPQMVYVEYQKERGSTALEKLCQCPVRYAQEISSFSFRANILDINRDASNHELHKILHDYLKMLTERTTSDFVIQVHERVITSLQNGNCSIDHIASSMGLNRRTFQRRLDDKGLKFKVLLEQTRMDLAQRYLRVSSITLTQISDMLCYADLASFSRSFNRYFGQAPSIWRRAAVNS